MDSTLTEDDISLLVVIVDVNAHEWANRKKSAKQIDFATFFEHLFIFINAYLMTQKYNRIAVIQTNPKESTFLYPPAQSNEQIQTEIVVDSQQLRKSVSEELNTFFEGVKNMPPQGSTFSAAISMALSYVNRIVKLKPKIRPRILTFSVTPDQSSQYIPIMNAILAAQRLNIIIDSCVLMDEDSSFLQQASHLTSGIYLRPKLQEGLLQYLLSTYITDTYSRAFVPLPRLFEVDYRASCFCHKKVLDQGYVCSVCLSIFCEAKDKCSTCGAEFSTPQPIKVGTTPSKSSTSNTNNNSTPKSPPGSTKKSLSSSTKTNNNNNNNDEEVIDASPVKTKASPRTKKK
jgi:transcription initiation factor TFIIH subunit 3